MLKSNNVDRKVLIVGGDTPIGMATIKALKSANYEVISICLPDDEIIIDENSHCPTYNFDYYNVEEINNNLSDIIVKYQPIYGFVFAAGKGGVRPLNMTKPTFILDMMNSNLISFVEFVRILTNKKRFCNGGSIVALSSVSSLKGLKSKLAYCSSKAALDAAVRVLAAELASKEIRVNSIRKGWVASDMKVDFIKDNMLLAKSSDFEQQLLGEITADEVADTICFLLCDASKKITGTSLLLDGGYML